MADKTSISAEDQALFRSHVKDVSPLKHDRVNHTPPAIKPKRRLAAGDEQADYEAMLSDSPEADVVDAPDELLFSRSGLQHSTLKKLRRGQFPIAGELDLHGLKVEEARHALGRFIHHHHLRKHQCVRIIHGKGFRSQTHRPILKNKVNHWLRQLREVLAFCSAQSSDGGTGAVYVLLSRK